MQHFFLLHYWIHKEAAPRGKGPEGKTKGAALVEPPQKIIEVRRQGSKCKALKLT